MKCVGFARRRYGRGGRVVLDRIRTDMDDVWSSLDFKIISNDSNQICAAPSPPLPSIKAETVTEMHNSIELVNDVSVSVVVKQEKLDYNEHRYNNKAEKLDDFEQLLDSANASFNIDKSIGAISSNLSAKLPNSKESSNANCIETTISNVTIKTEPCTESLIECGSNMTDTLMQTDTQNSLNSWNSNDHNIYQNLLDEIKSDWLHFHPVARVPTPEAVLDESEAVFDTDFELQIMDEDKDAVTKPFKPFFHFRLCS
jgi:hypothetical protein